MSDLSRKTDTSLILKNFGKDKENLSICDRIERAKLFAKSAKEIISSPFPPKSTERAVEQLKRDLKENRNQIKCLTEETRESKLNVLKEQDLNIHASNNRDSETSYQSHIQFSKITEFESETTNSPIEAQDFSNYSSNFLSFDPRSKLPEQKFRGGDPREMFIGEDLDDSYGYSSE